MAQVLGGAAEDPAEEAAATAVRLTGWGLLLAATRLKVDILMKALVLSALAFAFFAPAAWQRSPVDLLAEALGVNLFLVLFSWMFNVYLPLFMALESTAPVAGQGAVDWTTKKKRWQLHALSGFFGLLGTAVVVVSAPRKLTSPDTDLDLPGKTAIIGMLLATSCIGSTLGLLSVKTRDTSKSFLLHVAACAHISCSQMVGFGILIYYLIASVELANADLTELERILIFGFAASIVKGLVLAGCERLGKQMAHHSGLEDQLALQQVVGMWLAAGEVCCSLGSLYGMFLVRFAPLAACFQNYTAG